MGQKHLALLRGINVGGKNKILMADLAELFRSAGALEVKTFIQSGNVVFDPGDEPEAVFEAAVAGLQRHMGSSIPIVFRSRGELVTAIERNPFIKEGVDEKELALMFLRDTPSEEQVSGLDPQRSPADEFKVIGQEVYLRVRSFADTKLTNQYFDSRLKTVSTTRNWRVTKQLAELLA